MLRPNESCAMLSVSTPMYPYDDALPTVGWAEFRALSFEDVHTEPVPGDWLHENARLFNASLAAEVSEFYGRCQMFGVEDLIVHCDAGISRSVAIALWLAERNGSTPVLWDATEPLRPNRLVTQYMTAAANNCACP